MNGSLNPIKRFWKLLAPYKKKIYQIYLYGVLNGLVNLSLPLGIQAIIILIQGGQFSTAWIVLVAFVLFGYAVSGTFQVLQLRIVENIQQEIFARSSFEFAYRIPKIRLLELDRKHAPELVNRFFDTLTIQKGLPKILIDFSIASFQIIFGLILLAVYSSFFILFGIALLFLLWLLFRLTAPNGLKTSLEESKYKYQIAHWLEEIARVNKSFKLHARDILHLKKTDVIASKYLTARESHFQILLSQFRYFIAMKVLVAAGLLILGGILVFRQEMNIGQFVAAEIIIIIIINSIEKLIRVIETIYDVLTALEKIGYVTDLELEEQDGVGIVQSNGGIAVEALNLDFGFPDMKQRLIRDLSFRIPASSRTVITGEAGSGKSTLLHLIAGMYDIDDGDIFMNDVPIENINKEDFYTKTGFFFPSEQIFEGSILENITLGRKIPNVTIYEIIKVLGLKQYVSQQPQGVHTIIDPGGRRLPRNVNQRLLLARALASKPALLVMEDPLQFFLEKEKKRIIDYITDKRNKWTLIIVTDDNYWKEKCDQIIELSNG